jgi:tetrapyrrole methylase family protein / MazG family protein
MDYINISTILNNLKNEKIENIHIANGNKLYDRYTPIHSKDSFCLYKIDIDNERIDHLVEMFSKFYSAKYLIDIFCIKDSEIINKQLTIEKLKTYLVDKKRVYLLFRPVNGFTSMNKFQELIAHLRAPDGCPWDKEQTHKTLRTNLLEETYEVLDAIDEEDSDHLKEELGDLLLQIVLHSQIASEISNFSLLQVVDRVYNKIVHRHPHLFENERNYEKEDVLKNWEKIKAEERNQKGLGHIESILSSIPKQLPSLSVAQKYQERAARVGFDWKEIGPVYEKIDEELKEVIHATGNLELEQELGDLIFAVVNLVRWHGFDAESALRLTNKKFSKRFEYIEKHALKKGKLLTNISLSEMDDLWEQAKQKE